uniref:Peptidase S1 domain-containing protein n=1 Tax=Oryzias latipes TaxID=8090 RepID=A0A3B3HYH9_ORYLA
DQLSSEVELITGVYSSAVCGYAPLNSRLVGVSSVTNNGQWPWMASLQRNGKHVCGGTLVSLNAVLSNAECFSSGSASDVNVVLGLQSLQGSNLNKVSQTVTTVIIHPNYDSVTSDNDIALLQLSSPILQTIRSFSFMEYRCCQLINLFLLLVSLPAPQTLQEVQVPIVGNRQCKCSYGASSITDNMVCAGLLAGGKDSCQGDSGGPLVIKQNNRWIQAGVVSFGEGCVEPDYPGVYTRVSQYQTWINTQISSSQPGFIAFTSNGTDSDLSVSCPGVPPITTTSPEGNYLSLRV